MRPNWKCYRNDGEFILQPLVGVRAWNEIEAEKELIDWARRCGHTNLVAELTVLFKKCEAYFLPIEEGE